MNEPLAKGKHKGEGKEITLRQHSSDVLLCALSMIEALKTYLPESNPPLRQIIQSAAIYHDLGKAASGMQNVLINGGRWRFRHEILSVSILLAAGLPEELKLALAAILTHHKSINNQSLRDDLRLFALPEEEDFVIKCWQQIASEMDTHWDWVREFIRTSDPEIGSTLANTLPEKPHNLPDIRHFFNQIEETLRQDNITGISKESLPYILSRGILMAADHLASSGQTTAISELQPKPTKLRRFQKQLAKHKGPAILEAPTGSGKTHAAIAWALANREAGERIFYVLPYQASINAMFKTLSSNDGFGFGENNVGVIHHNALLHEFRRHFDETPGNYKKAANTAHERVDLTKQFYRPIKIITPYQILKLLFGCKRFEIGLSEMLGGLVIFDEIHAYDPHVAALIEVALSRLNVLEVRYLFMSATFPEFLRERLAGCVPSLTRFHIEGKDNWEKSLLNQARHRLMLHNHTLEELLPKIVEAAKSGTVLVVCNRIEQAKRIFKALNECVDSVSLLHGGFIMRDRLHKENELFKKAGSREPACRVLVATQVVEVSLDISFNTIFTEVAPVDDLLQRFGRVNRVNEMNQPADVHVALLFDEDKLKYIYDPERLRLTITHAPDGKELTADIEREWVENVYAGGYLPKEEEAYNRAKESFQQVVNSIRPMHDGCDSEFYALFNTWPAVPAELFPQYYKLIQSEEYLLANQLLMSLHASTYHELHNNDGIEMRTVGDKHIQIWIVKRKYDQNLGLTSEIALPPPAGMEDE